MFQIRNICVELEEYIYSIAIFIVLLKIRIYLTLTYHFNYFF